MTAGTDLEQCYIDLHEWVDADIENRDATIEIKSRRDGTFRTAVKVTLSEYGREDSFHCSVTRNNFEQAGQAALKIAYGRER